MIVNITDNEICLLSMGVDFVEQRYRKAVSDTDKAVFYGRAVELLIIVGFIDSNGDGRYLKAISKMLRQLSDIIDEYKAEHTEGSKSYTTE